MKKKKAANHFGHVCNCKAYNGGQCYNCLNGAHRICEDGSCKKRNAKQLGVRLVFNP